MQLESIIVPNIKVRHTFCTCAKGIVTIKYTLIGYLLANYICLNP